MKKIGKFIKSNVKLVIGIIVGVVIAGGSAAVVSAIAGSQVTYTDTNNIGATTVQGAIDKLYEMASSSGSSENYGCPNFVYRNNKVTKYNVTATYSGSTRTDGDTKLTSSEYTTDYTTLNSVRFLGHCINDDGYILSSYACGVYNGVFFCLEGSDSDQSSLTSHPVFEKNYNTLCDKVFPTHSNCTAFSSKTMYFEPGTDRAYIKPSGEAYVYYGSGNGMCGVYLGQSYCR